MSYGGPSDWFELTCNSDGEWLGGVYVFQDWGDGAREALSMGQIEAVAMAYGIEPERESEAL